MLSTMVRVGLVLMLVACGADEDPVDSGLEDSGTPDAGVPDTGMGDAGPACLIEWNVAQMNNIGRTCGVGGDEGSQLCLEVTVDADGNITAIAPGPDNDVPFDGMTELCLMDEVAGRCVPRLAGSSEQHCAYGP